MNIIFTLNRHVIIDHEGHLLNIDATGEQIRADHDTNRARPKIVHLLLTVFHLHLSMNVFQCKSLGRQLFRQPFRLVTFVHIDQCLIHRQILIEVQEDTQLPFLTLQGHKILFDPVQRDFLGRQQNPNRVRQIRLRNVQHMLGHCRTEKRQFRGRGEGTVQNGPDLLGKQFFQHLVGFIQNNVVNMLYMEFSAANQIKHTTWGSDHRMNACLKDADVLVEFVSSCGRENFEIHKGANGADHALGLLGEFAGRAQDQHLGGLKGCIYYT